MILFIEGKTSYSNLPVLCENQELTMINEQWRSVKGFL